ncbi:MAG TPA: dienelactone hydrolase family protein [Candidatus Tectomicrobia bacterium]|nr:dienelactone hydrolase family protein [Candidatus Tectomicrobia bacterium]
MSELLDAVELETGPAPGAAILWMHGLGADGHDFVDLVPVLGLPEAPGVRFVFPHAPMRPVTINHGMVMRAWYDVRGDAGERREDEAGVRASQQRLEALIAREKQRGVPASRLVLAGFSQGGAMALHTGLRHPERLAGILALSCFLPLSDTVAAEAAAANRDTPIFMAHGTQDSVIPAARARRSRDALTALGYRVDYREYPMPHAVCDAEIRDVAAWLREVLGLAD